MITVSFDAEDYKALDPWEEDLMSLVISEVDRQIKKQIRQLVEAELQKHHKAITRAIAHRIAMTDFEAKADELLSEEL